MAPERTPDRQHRLPPARPAPDADLRRRARALAATAGSRLRLAAGRAGGERGVALACALIDMIADDVHPGGWPVAEAIAVLRPEAVRDRQIQRLLDELHAIQDRIAILIEEADDEELVRRPAA